MTIVEFVLARIDEIEVAAEAALDRGFGGWEWLADAGINYEARTHIVHHHPARVLAECAAKRAMVEDFEYHVRTYGDAPTVFGKGQRFGALMACAQLAMVHADHPDYNEAWRP